MKPLLGSLSLTFAMICANSGVLQAQTFSAAAGREAVQCALDGTHTVQSSWTLSEVSGTVRHSITPSNLEAAQGNSISRLADLHSTTGEDGKLKEAYETIPDGMTFSLRWTDFSAKGTAALFLRIKKDELQDPVIDLLDGSAKGSYPLGPILAHSPGAKAPYVVPTGAFVLRNWNGRDLLIKLADPQKFSFADLSTLGVLELRIIKDSDVLSTSVIDGEVRLIKQGEIPAP